jgi:nitroreductase
MAKARLIPHPSHREIPAEEMLARAEAFRDEMRRRRSVRDFSPRPIPEGVVERCIEAAASAPSGANMQPWHFVVVGDAATKRRIREAAEIEEREFYERRAPKEWLEALEPIGTDWRKPFLETAPRLIVIFEQRYGARPDGTKVKHYYSTESVGIAAGMLIAAVHRAGLASLTHTPSPMKFLNKILDRPANERPFLILVVGYPAEGATVPAIEKREIERIITHR